MIDVETKTIIRNALRTYRGDDYIRAMRAFSGLTSDAMLAPHGSSGQSRQSILDGYREHVERVDKALAAIEAL